MASKSPKGGKQQVCVFCEQGDVCQEVYGKLLSKGGIAAHYFCMLFSSGLSQNGKTEKQGILGFLQSDIMKEVKRGCRLRCSFCKKGGATIGCVVRNCKKMFHLGCGRENSTLHQFFGTFSSFCSSHRIQQDVPSDDDPSIVCSICMNSVTAAPSNDTIQAPCCRKYWYHRDCVQRYATSAGLYFFKCPLCNNKDDFQDEMLTMGIYIPDQDASWEKEPHAFQELLERYGHCDAPLCKCAEGRKYDKEGSKWEIILCDFCGSHGAHVACNHLGKLGKHDICDSCKEVDERTRERELLMNSPPNKRKSLEMLQLELSVSPDPSKGESPYPGPSDAMRKKGLPSQKTPVLSNTKPKSRSKFASKKGKRQASDCDTSQPKSKKQKLNSRRSATVTSATESVKRFSEDNILSPNTSTSHSESSDDDIHLSVLKNKIKLESAWDVQRRRKLEYKKKNAERKAKKKGNTCESEVDSDVERKNKGADIRKKAVGIDSDTDIQVKNKGKHINKRKSGAGKNSVISTDSEKEFELTLDPVKGKSPVNKKSNNRMSLGSKNSEIWREVNGCGKAKISRLSVDSRISASTSNADEKNKVSKTKKRSIDNDKSQTMLTSWFKPKSMDIQLKTEPESEHSPDRKKKPVVIEWQGKQLLIRSPRVILKRRKAFSLKPKILEIDMNDAGVCTDWKSDIDLLSNIEADVRVTRTMIDTDEQKVKHEENILNLSSLTNLKQNFLSKNASTSLTKCEKHFKLNKKLQLVDAEIDKGDELNKAKDDDVTSNKKKSSGKTLNECSGSPANSMRHSKIKEAKAEVLDVDHYGSSKELAEKTALLEDVNRPSAESNSEIGNLQSDSRPEDSLVVNLRIDTGVGDSSTKNLRARKPKDGLSDANIAPATNILRDLLKKNTPEKLKPVLPESPKALCDSPAKNLRIRPNKNRSFTPLNLDISEVNSVESHEQESQNTPTNKIKSGFQFFVSNDTNLVTEGKYTSVKLKESSDLDEPRSELKDSTAKCLRSSRTVSGEDFDKSIVEHTAKNLRSRTNRKSKNFTSHNLEISTVNNVESVEYENQHAPTDQLENDFQFLGSKDTKLVIEGNDASVILKESSDLDKPQKEMNDSPAKCLRSSKTVSDEDFDKSIELTDKYWRTNANRKSKNSTFRNLELSAVNNVERLELENQLAPTENLKNDFRLNVSNDSKIVTLDDKDKSVNRKETNRLEAVQIGLNCSPAKFLRSSKIREANSENPNQEFDKSLEPTEKNMSSHTNRRSKKSTSHNLEISALNNVANIEQECQNTTTDTTKSDIQFYGSKDTNLVTEGIYTSLNLKESSYLDKSQREINDSPAKCLRSSKTVSDEDFDKSIELTEKYCRANANRKSRNLPKLELSVVNNVEDVVFENQHTPTEDSKNELQFNVSKDKGSKIVYVNEKDRKESSELDASESGVNDSPAKALRSSKTKVQKANSEVPNQDFDKSKEHTEKNMKNHTNRKSKHLTDNLEISTVNNIENVENENQHTPKDKSKSGLEFFVSKSSKSVTLEDSNSVNTIESSELNDQTTENTTNLTNADVQNTKSNNEKEIQQNVFNNECSDSPAKNLRRRTYKNGNSETCDGMMTNTVTENESGLEIQHSGSGSNSQPSSQLERLRKYKPKFHYLNPKNTDTNKEQQRNKADSGMADREKEAEKNQLVWLLEGTRQLQTQSKTHSENGEGDIENTCPNTPSVESSPLTKDFSLDDILNRKLAEIHSILPEPESPGGKRIFTDDSSPIFVTKLKNSRLRTETPDKNVILIDDDSPIFPTRRDSSVRNNKADHTSKAANYKSVQNKTDISDLGNSVKTVPNSKRSLLEEMRKKTVGKLLRSNSKSVQKAMSQSPLENHVTDKLSMTEYYGDGFNYS